MATQNPDEAGEDSKGALFTKPVGKLKLNASAGDENSAAAATENGSGVDGGDSMGNMDLDAAENNDETAANNNDSNSASPTLLKKNRAMAATTNGTSAGDHTQSASGANATGDGEGGGVMISPESINGQA